MIAALLGASLIAASPEAAVSPFIAQASHALDVGRTEQARRMIADAVGRGATATQVDPLLARLALAQGDDAEALPRLRELLRGAPEDATLLVGAATAAARLRQDAEAQGFATRAAKLPSAGWRVFNLLGVLADRRGDWKGADQAYAEALRRDPANAAVLNNRGWSRLTRGEWLEAQHDLATAAARDPGSKVIADNLELVRAALAEDLPRRRTGESDSDFAARLNDAGIVARLSGDETKAVAAFTRAVEVRGRWYERAYNNLHAGRTAAE